jgi:hypothetical protein
MRFTEHHHYKNLVPFSQDPPFLEMKCCPVEVNTKWDFQGILNEGAQLLPGTQATPAETRPVRFRYMSHLEETGDFLGV